jgi:hypothetical protein
VASKYSTFCSEKTDLIDLLALVQLLIGPPRVESWPRVLVPKDADRNCFRQHEVQA